MSDSPFGPWWYYEMGREAGKHTVQPEESDNIDGTHKKSKTDFSIISFFFYFICIASLIIAFLPIVALIVFCIWYFF